MTAQDVYQRLKQLWVIAVHIKFRGKGGSNTRTPGPGPQIVMKALACLGLKLEKLKM